MTLETAWPWDLEAGSRRAPRSGRPVV